VVGVVPDSVDLYLSTLRGVKEVFAVLAARRIGRISARHDDQHSTVAVSFDRTKFLVEVGAPVPVPPVQRQLNVPAV
jgi:hypothetical protein